MVESSDVTGAERTPQQELQARLAEYKRWLDSIVQENQHMEARSLHDMSHVPVRAAFKNVARQITGKLSFSEYGLIDARDFINRMQSLIEAMRETAEDPKKTDLINSILMSSDFLTLLGHIDSNFSPSSTLVFSKTESGRVAASTKVRIEEITGQI